MLLCMLLPHAASFMLLLLQKQDSLLIHSRWTTTLNMVSPQKDIHCQEDTNNRQGDFQRVTKKKNARQRRKQQGSSDYAASWTEDPSPPLQFEYIAPDPSNSEFQPFMLLLMGLPGSGKSTWAKSLVEAMPHKFARVNQDEMKSRQNCVAEAKLAMAEKKCIIVDRCNFDGKQRQTWYQLALDYQYPVDCVAMLVSVPLCIKRCQVRSNHETVKPGEAEKIVNMVKAQWKLPQNEEKAKSIREYSTIKNPQDFKHFLKYYLEKK